MTYEWQDNNGVKHVTTWTKAVQNAMIRGGAESHRQKALNQVKNNWKVAARCRRGRGMGGQDGLRADADVW